MVFLSHTTSNLKLNSKKIRFTIQENFPLLTVKVTLGSNWVTSRFIYIYIYTVIPRLTSDPVNEFFG